MRTVHHKPHPPSALVITNLPEAEIRVTSNQCGICCKNFSSSKVIHQIFSVFILLLLGTFKPYGYMQRQISLSLCVLQKHFPLP